MGREKSEISKPFGALRHSSALKLHFTLFISLFSLLGAPSSLGHMGHRRFLEVSLLRDRRRDHYHDTFPEPGVYSPSSNGRNS
jgi:hypothetical protein